ncbi:uncharacterized protein METZ01_LOCUS118658, partial [marine metagenome]
WRTNIFSMRPDQISSTLTATSILVTQRSINVLPKCTVSSFFILKNFAVSSHR